MIPDWFAAIDRAWELLRPGGTIGVVDFYVARKYAVAPFRRHSWFTRSFWPVWFASDNVFPSPDHVPYLHRRFEVIRFSEHFMRMRYLPFFRMPYYIFIGRKPGSEKTGDEAKRHSRVEYTGVRLPTGLPTGQEVSRVRVAPLYAQPEPTISFEFFPPKTEEGEATLFREVVPALKRLNPAFMTVTYGAGGGTRSSTLRIVSTILREHSIPSAAHLTCSGSTKEMLAAVLDEARQLGIKNILALRGDPPAGQALYEPTPGGFPFAIDLIRYIKSLGHFGIGAAGYPEGHIQCPDKKLDWDRCAAKVEAGAEFIITQLFYDVNDFLEFEDYLRNKRGVKVPIVPGILPFINGAQIRRITKLCGAKMSDHLVGQLEHFAGDDESVRKLGVEVCTSICRRLLDHGVPGIHFYCLNRVLSCQEILRNLRLAT
jgi:methylenetetrahydrofolate reductase (NADPH)